jgi:dynein heavy chain 1
MVSRLRKDRLEIALRNFAEGLIPAQTNSMFEDMKELLRYQVTADTPIIFCSVPGHDASSQVEALVTLLKAPCISVAMGSAESALAADQAIGTATRTGSWVLLKNLHLAPHWLHSLERRLRSLAIHPDFRLFLTMETARSIPASIIEMSRIVMNEPLPGIKANLLEALAAMRPELSAPGPSERDRLYFLLAWLHTILQERSRYVPIGFTKSYGFNDSDLAAGKLMLDRWVGYAAKGRSHIDPKSLPWMALRTLLITNIYGGKVDSETDLLTIEGFVKRFIAPDAYDSGFSLATNAESPAIFEISRFDQFVQWANALPADQPISWLDLPVDSDMIMAERQGRR